MSMLDGIRMLPTCAPEIGCAYVPVGLQWALSLGVVLLVVLVGAVMAIRQRR